MAMREATRRLPGRFVTRGSAALATAAWLSSCGSPPSNGQAQAPRSPTPRPTAGVVRVETVARGLEHPWALEFLPDGRMLVTERPGRVRIVDPSGRISEPLAGVPEVEVGGQGGLLDVALDPSFAENRLVYLSYAEPGEGGAGTAVARGRLGEGRLEDVRVIYRQQPKVGGGNHFGSRLVFAHDGRLFVTQGERFGYRERAQDLSNHLGKIVRIAADGSVPDDNPFVGTAGARPEIWSYGHRNIQAAAIHPETGQLWTWQGSVLVGSLQPGALVRLQLEGGKVVREERYRDDGLGERIRDVQQGPDGLVYVLTDESNGRVLRVLPAGR
jgi:glucose/arabinose dehydrogenase